MAKLTEGQKRYRAMLATHDWSKETCGTCARRWWPLGKDVCRVPLCAAGASRHSGQPRHDDDPACELHKFEEEKRDGR